MSSGISIMRGDSSALSREATRTVCAITSMSWRRVVRGVGGGGVNGARSGQSALIFFVGQFFLGCAVGVETSVGSETSWLVSRGPWSRSLPWQETGSARAVANEASVDGHALGEFLEPVLDENDLLRWG